ncbi:MAG TPA: winged helix-turn-helix transcriptional regulator [Urbifossiella sp.]|nr:winged helix-turn-helix transcriptional regulator [Urbifossiella sp.]
MTKRKENANSGRILEYLASHPFKSRKDISTDTGIPLDTVHRQVRSLEESGHVREGIVVTDPFHNGFERFHIFIETQHGELDGFPSDTSKPNSLISQIRAELARRNHESKDIVLENIDILMGGDWDVALIVRAQGIYPVGEFVTEFLRAKKNIRRTKTATVWRPRDTNAPSE